MLDDRHEAPLHLVSDLVKRWDQDKALVFADWLEHQGFPGFAQQLRRKTFETYSMIYVVERLAHGMGLTTPTLSGADRRDWKRGGKRERKRLARYRQAEVAASRVNLGNEYATTPGAGGSGGGA